MDLMDARYAEPSIYKYYYFPSTQMLRAFFSNPTLKFTHRDDLNDPFELSRRWAKFGCPFTEAILDKYVGKRVEKQLSNIKFVRRKMRQYADERGLVFSKAQIRQLSSPEHMEVLRAEQSKKMELMFKFFPTFFRESGNDLMEGFSKKTGILSLTGDPSSQYMWREYAHGGQGFVIEFDAQHHFFSIRGDNNKRRSVLRQVFYRDDRIDDFWDNPYYLFLVKEKKWAFEKEWRMLRRLDECRKLVTEDGRTLYLTDAPKGLIKSVIVGYDCPSSVANEITELVKQYDTRVRLCEARLDAASNLVTYL